jgi:hypothetical protein
VVEGDGEDVGQVMVREGLRGGCLELGCCRHGDWFELVAVRYSVPRHLVLRRIVTASIQLPSISNKQHIQSPGKCKKRQINHALISLSRESGRDPFQLKLYQHRMFM